MQPFETLVAIAAPLDLANIDTNTILPGRFLRKQRGPGYERCLFHDLRFDPDDQERPDFVLNQPAYRNAKILVAGLNFGWGSSREGAVYALWDYGIRSVIAPSFGDIHYGNQLQNGMLPLVLPEQTCRALSQQLHERPGVAIRIELAAQTVTAPDGAQHRFEIDPAHKERLLKGLDDVALVMQHLSEIERAEARLRDEMPWLERQ
jgi:3-isopropylmalate/(R)-2-methylmalate dehydratase small subunit